ncbi:MAG TPA: glycosyltransferase family 4 protein [Candidatus Binatia bacterium]|nr:glycosyltransferase family 4 protein [Candidatus Binatia bacterium]
MRITHVSSLDIQGGAARAAYRLHRGLLGLGQDSRLLTPRKASTDETVHRLGVAPEATDLAHRSLQHLQRDFIDAQRTSVSNTLFILPYPGYDLTARPEIRAADVINLHWVSRLQSPITLHRLLQLGPPVVWTLHDMWAFTGGCCYSSGCDGFERDCRPCPQLRADPHGLTAAVLGDKLAVLEPRPTVVAPSRWLAAAARRSRLFRNTRIEVIPYSLETEAFAPAPKTEARRRLGLDPETLILLAGADNGNERRKGFPVLADALRICVADPCVRERKSRGAITLLWFGTPPDGLDRLPLPALALGRIAEDERLRLIYSAADLYLLSSLEDNLPNTMLEAMSCGTPVVAFDVGGVPDVLEDGVTGRVVPAGDAPRLAAAILDVLRDDSVRRKMSEACRRVMEINHALDVQARRYLDLYEDLLRRASRLDAAGSPLAPGAWRAAPPHEEGPAPRPPSSLDASGEGPLIPADSGVGPAFQPILRRWSLQVAQADFEELERARADVERLRGRIGAMESSKFWKLRALWFRVRRTIGFPGSE